MSDIRTVNVAFERFLNEIKNIKNNIEEESEFSKGYLQCINDITRELSNDEWEDLDGGVSANYLVNTIKRRIDMQSRSALLNELVPGLSKLLDAYKADHGDGTE